MYPLPDEYLPIIKLTIEKLNQYSGIQVKTFPTATILMGEDDLVIDAIKETMRWSQDKFGKAVFIAKFLPDYSAL